ncbi:MAG TPA: rhomboid family intramembrane serine protease, partial [Blastocatellia bacterium]|nr:rhomboid family intramembrane serine protease [Blastocatellia bacterium]
MDQAANQSDIRVCAGCGRLIPADAPECAYCGARSEKVEEALREATLQERFARAIFKRSSPFTYLFIGINLGVFILMWLAGGMGAMSANPEVIVGFGAKENDLINNQQQYWRLVTSIFIHIGFLHLFFNNYALYIIGQQIELLYGSSRFVLLYLLTGIAGSTASYLYNTQTAAGASGAIFGLFGVMAIFAFRYRKEIPQGMQSSIKRQVIPLIVINLIITFSIPLIDKSAHIGGLVAGVILGLIIPYKRPQERRTAALWRVLLVVCMLVIFGSLGAAYSAYSGPP